MVALLELVAILATVLGVGMMLEAKRRFQEVKNFWREDEAISIREEVARRKEVNEYQTRIESLNIRVRDQQRRIDDLMVEGKVKSNRRDPRWN